MSIHRGLGRIGLWVAVQCTFSLSSISLAEAQDTAAVARPGAAKTFFTSSDLAYAGAALATSAVVSHFDVRIAHWSQRDAIQGSQARQDLVHSLTQVNEGPLTIASVVTYGVGRLTGSNTITDIGAHMTESLALTVAVSELIRIPVGRTRPRESLGDQYNFHFGGGFSKFEERSFPSLHSSAAFATASALVGEIRERRPELGNWAAPVLFTAALIPGFTRIHLDEHWASDV